MDMLKITSKESVKDLSIEELVLIKIAVEANTHEYPRAVINAD